MISIKVKNFIKENSLIPKNSTLILGLSGGPDSVCLLYILNSLKEDLDIKIVAAHLDHEWRQNSKKDVEFCKNLCDKLSINFISEKVSNLKVDLKKSGSQEDIGRQMRRYFFEETANKFGTKHIVLGQHLQDQEENFFIRLIRGTSLSGLTGIKAKEKTSTDFVYIRPLIETSKEEILQYLKEQNLQYLIDPTNLDETFLRNRIRNRVIPEIKSCDDRFDSNFLRTVRKLQQADNFINSITVKELNNVVINQKLDIKKLLILDKYLHNRIVLMWLIENGVAFNISENFLNEIIKFLTSEHGGTHQIGTWSIEKKENKAKIIK